MGSETVEGEPNGWEAPEKKEEKPEVQETQEVKAEL